VYPGLSSRTAEEALPPTLVSLGRFSGNSSSIVGAYPGRGIHLWVAEDFDVRIAMSLRMRCSPFGWSFAGRRATS
jgi:hypothetical protein